MSDEVVRDPARIARWTAEHEAALAALADHDTPEARRRELAARYQRWLAAFGEADSDLYVGTYSKSGTTWMQVLLYQLTTPGDMGFDHFFDVSPWVWYAALRRVPPATVPAPRILKSHDPIEHFAPDVRGRFVCVLRDGKDVCVSWFHHRRSFKGYTGTWDEHVEEFIHGEDYSWFRHVRGWLDNPAGLPITYVHFEDLRRDLVGTARALVQALDLDVDDGAYARVAAHCTFAAMKAHERQLGPRVEHFADAERPAYVVQEDKPFLRRGEVGEGVVALSEAQRDAYRRRFDEILGDHARVAAYR